METNTQPYKGQKIFVPSALHVYRGSDDFAGGEATIAEIFPSKTLPPDHYNYLMVSIEERPDTQYNWNYLVENQQEWADQYKGRKAHPDPDYRPQFNKDNDWERLPLS